MRAAGCIPLLVSHTRDLMILPRPTADLILVDIVICSVCLGLFETPPGTQSDVIVTINWPSLCTHWANPPPALVAYVLSG